LTAFIEAIRITLDFNASAMDDLWNQLPHYTLSLASFYWALFFFELTRGVEETRNFRLILVILAVLMAFIVYVSLYIFIQLPDFSLYIFALLYVSTTIYIYTRQITASFRTARQTGDTLKRRGLIRIGWSGVAFILAIGSVFTFTIGRMIMEPDSLKMLNWIGYLLAALGMVVLYRGFVLPMKEARSSEPTGPVPRPSAQKEALESEN